MNATNAILFVIFIGFFQVSCDQTQPNNVSDFPVNKVKGDLDPNSDIDWYSKLAGRWDLDHMDFGQEGQEMSPEKRNQLAKMLEKAREHSYMELGKDGSFRQNLWMGKDQFISGNWKMDDKIPALIVTDSAGNPPQILRIAGMSPDRIAISLSPNPDGMKIIYRRINSIK